ncbi:helix-turn-helix domain-containing protein [Actinomadura logoneensis]|uniref:Helix-turn-helix domain-containing protein n=1 Tax=Actinomadura logoneensis TaxID=2293572 RepID=A0A372JDD3_9ACTN|nr:helix-turn-helix domain-containing protein [Actinomadura logoneensis]RFU37836.1 helix-turn-helix domain-containing protein [Actinomadura logoneensis]
MHRGGFLREAKGRRSFLDPATGYVNLAGTQERFASPVDNNYIFTAIIFTPDAFDEHAGVLARRRDGDWAFPVSAAVGLRHRELLGACHAGADRLEIEERLHTLLDVLLAQPPVGTGDATVSAATRAQHHRLVSRVQEALNSGHLTTGLDELAGLVGSSPHHLSRVFRRVTGRTITAYRNDLRVRAVLEDLAQGPDTALADLAAAHGFTDHSHLTRTIRNHLGECPSALRGKLTAAGAT